MIAFEHYNALNFGVIHKFVYMRIVARSVMFRAILGLRRLFTVHDSEHRTVCAKVLHISSRFQILCISCKFT